MNSTGANPDTSTELSEVGTIDMKLEVVTLPVSDVDRAKRFYASIHWHDSVSADRRARMPLRALDDDQALGLAA